MGSSWIAKSKCDNLSSSYMISSLYKLFTYCEELLSSKRRNELAKKTFSVLIDCLDFLDILTFQKHQLIFFHMLCLGWDCSRKFSASWSQQESCRCDRYLAHAVLTEIYPQGLDSWKSWAHLSMCIQKTRKNNIVTLKIVSFCWFKQSKVV